MKGQESRILQSVAVPKTSSQTLALIISEPHYCRSNELVQLLIEDLRHDDEVRALGVVDDRGQVQGIVVRRQLSTLMLKPYAQDILKQRRVDQIMESARSFPLSESIFSVAEEIRQEMTNDEVSYFLVNDGDGGFAGIFSTLDILNYMSHLMQQDVALASRLQKRIVKEKELVVGSSFEYISSNQTAKGVGGDFTSIQKIAKHRWLLSLCDVSGKGIAASVITSVLWGMMSIYDFSKGLKEFIRNLNEYLVKTFEAEKFITGLFIELHEMRHQLKICDMGHSHIFLLRRDTLHNLEVPGGNMPLGVIPDLDPRIHRLNYQPGDLIFLMTDGLIEQENRKGDIYGMERVSEILVREAGRPVEHIHDLIIRDFKKFRQDQILNDDVSMTLIRFAEQEVVIE